MHLLHKGNVILRVRTLHADQDLHVLGNWVVVRNTDIIRWSTDPVHMCRACFTILPKRNGHCLVGSHVIRIFLSTTDVKNASPDLRCWFLQPFYKFHSRVNLERTQERDRKPFRIRYRPTWFIMINTAVLFFVESQTRKHSGRSLFMVGSGSLRLRYYPKLT